MFRSRVLEEIRGLDPVRDHQRIVFLSTRVGRGSSSAAKRYDDTDILVSELLEHGYDSDRGRAALARMNAIHGRFRIANEDFLYVLSTFVFEPIRFNARFGWRRMTQDEKLALFHFWRAVGLRMGIHDIPVRFKDFERYGADYELRRYRFTEANRAVGAATVELFASWFPRPLRPLVRQGIYALLDTRPRDAFGFPAANPIIAALVVAAMKARAAALRCWPRRRHPSLRTAMTHPTYPKGYEIETLGP